MTCTFLTERGLTYAIVRDFVSSRLRRAPCTPENRFGGRSCIHNYTLTRECPFTCAPVKEPVRGNFDDG